MASTDVGLGTMGLGTGPLGGGYQLRQAEGVFNGSEGLGEAPLGTSPLGIGIDSVFQGTSTHDREDFVYATGRYRKFQGEATIQLDLSVVSSGEFRHFQGDAVTDVSTFRDGVGEYGHFQGESTRDPLAYTRSSGGEFGAFQGTSAEGANEFERFADGQYGHFEAESTRSGVGSLIARAAAGEFAKFQGESTTHNPNWVIGGNQLHELIEETRTWQELTLVFRVSSDMLDNRVRPLGSHAGQYEITVDSDGGFSVEDLTGGSNTYTVQAPEHRQDVRYMSTYHTKEISDIVIDQDTEDYEVEIVMVATDTKELQDSYFNSNPDTGEWEFNLWVGGIATSRVNAELNHSLVDGADSYEFSMVLTPQQVIEFEENINRLEAVEIVEVPDGDNYATDHSNGNSNVVRVTPPSGADIDIDDSTDMAIQEWETEWLNDDFYEVTFTATILPESQA